MPKEILFLNYVVKYFALKLKFPWNRILTSQFWELMLTGEYRHYMYLKRGLRKKSLTLLKIIPVYAAAKW